MTKENPFQDIIPVEHLTQLGQAVANGKLCLTLVVSHESMTELNQGKSTLLLMQDGGVILLVPQSLLEKSYEVPPDISQAR